ncbi:MAG: hypothetical protein IPJ82_05005 [Lewinellaceae bacterium]|nr:hypothetical protein [Lewinellaceae bacterium]
MKELNINTLQKALGQLPEYEPPTGLWDDLEAALDADGLLSESARSLPQYDPPAQIWSNLENALVQKKAIRIGFSRKILAAAAVGLLLLGAWWFMSPDTSKQGRVVVTQETLNEEIRNSVQEKDDAAFEMLETLCASRAPVCEQPDFIALKSELDELSEAKKELRNTLGRYGDDPALAAQLVRIERERSGLLRQMMTMI